MDTWIEFYKPFFPTHSEAKEWVEKLEALDSHDHRHRAKILMHLVQRLVSLADDVEKIRPGKESLKLAFLIICAENVAKLYCMDESEGQSRSYVRKFFEEFITGEDRYTIETSFTKHDQEPLNLQAVADCLYSVRCDVVHEGKYWGFHFHNGQIPMLNTDPNVNVSIPFPMVSRHHCSSWH